ncbi:BlaI/MecI/CopY family transcriptional regulator [Frankia sp. AgKG'84/4]|uniref:BlaI/MecI/CopY family transcriptional regulator n=1 Tax=Frankia sp. AgKG'84/4 TaxID=573490 RepID=UPI00200F627E|nr:BlaI/MecI/CopY family transcriptional regulator [Frankia sp. AgKG'84/4]MCL9795168.1 BlaI/MecI/CopY family transcriptional regulator [Frankia sp. AgKG'84/4]
MTGGLEINCAELVEIVTDYLDGALDANTHRRFIEHLDLCDPERLWQNAWDALSDPDRYRVAGGVGRGAARSAGAASPDTGGDDLAYTTVMTILNRQHVKGEVTRVALGRTYLYQPAQNTAQLTARRMRGQLEQVDDTSGALARFVDTPDAAQEQVLRDLLSWPRPEG